MHLNASLLRTKCMFVRFEKKEPSAIKNNRNPNYQGFFKKICNITKEMIGKDISNLKIRKAVSSNGIPTKILKDFQGILATYIFNNYIKSLPYGTFPEDLKTAEVAPVYKKKKML